MLMSSDAAEAGGSAPGGRGLQEAVLRRLHQSEAEATEGTAKHRRPNRRRRKVSRVASALDKQLPS